MAKKTATIPFMRIAPYYRWTTSEQLRYARTNGVCRICLQPILLTAYADYPQEFDKFCGLEVVQGGVRVTLGYGEEYAHTECLIDRSQEVRA